MVNNTTFLGFSMMFYMLFVCILITHVLRETKWISEITTTMIGILDLSYFLLPILTDMHFYDTWWFWAITQTIANVVLLYCLLRTLMTANNKTRFVYGGIALLLIAFEADILATLLGCWQGGFASKIVFTLLFAAALFIVLRSIPGSINAAAKAKELDLQRSRLEAEKNSIEAELKESRISIMLSQIQPHFIYNTLGTIERMCLKDSQKAFDLVRNFSLYLRGNFSKLDSVTPIRFADELQHVEYYVNIEKVRFPDMCIEYRLETTDFVLPALTVQPLVENAIKHGLMRLEKGGSVIIKDIDDGLNLAYPDEGKKFARAVEICARNDTAGYRHSGRQIYTLLKRSGYRDVRLEKNGLSTINMDFEERSALFDTYFSFILEDLKIMRERYPDDARIKKDLEWYDETYEEMEEQFQDDAFYFTLGFVMFTAKR